MYAHFQSAAWSQESFPPRETAQCKPRCRRKEWSRCLHSSQSPLTLGVRTQLELCPTDINNNILKTRPCTVF